MAFKVALAKFNTTSMVIDFARQSFHPPRIADLVHPLISGDVFPYFLFHNFTVLPSQNFQILELFSSIFIVYFVGDFLIEAEDNIALITQAYDFAARVAECTSLTAKEIFVHNLIEFAVKDNAV